MEQESQPVPPRDGAPPPTGGQPRPGEDLARFLEPLRHAVDAYAIIAVTDRRGIILFVNDRFCEISKFPREALIGQTHRLVNSGYHSAEFWREFWDTILAGRPWSGVMRNRASDGTIYWADTVVTPILGSDGRPEYFLSLRTDITRLKAVEDELSRLTHGLEARVRERTEQLAKSEQLYRLLLSSVTDYHYTVEVRNGKAVGTVHTPSCIAVTGYTPEEFQQDKDLWFKMVYAEDRPEVLAHAQAAVQGLALTPLEHRIVRKDGVVRWIRDRVVIRRDATGQVVFYDGIITDITAEKLAQGEVQKLTHELESRVIERTAQLKAAHDQLRVLFEHAPFGISWVEWGEPEVHHLNDRFCQIIGLTPEESRRYDNIVNAMHPEDRPRVAGHLAELRHGAGDRFACEVRYVHRDGRIVWGQLTVVVLRDDAGRIAQQFAMVADITHRVHAEAELRRSEQQLRRYFENASEILYSLTASDVFATVSPAWTGKLGHAVSSVVGRPFASFVHPDDLAACRAFFQEVRTHGFSLRTVEYRMQHLDGTWRWHASSGSIVEDETGGRLFFGIGRDVSVRRQAQEELRAALARREELERIINRSPSVIVLWRAGDDWPVEFVSQSISQFGYAPEELMGGQVRFIDLVHPEDAPRVVDEVRRHAAAGHREYRQEYRIVTRAGEVRWIDDRTLTRSDRFGRVTHHEGIITDITARHEAEEKEREARERDLQVARDVQQHLLPQVYPDISEAEIAALYTASRGIGGDYYDFFPIDERRWGFAVADVSGKGAAAAMIMAACRTALRVKAMSGWNPASVVRMVNYTVQPDMPRSMFISMIYGILDLDTNVFTFCRAGHEPPLVLRHREGTVAAACPSGMAIGLDAGTIFDELLEESTLVLEAQDLIVLYTDGITETANAEGEEFGRDRLAAVVRQSAGRTLDEVRAMIHDALDRFAPGQPAADDRTLLLVRPR